MLPLGLSLEKFGPTAVVILVILFSKNFVATSIANAANSGFLRTSIRNSLGPLRKVTMANVPAQQEPPTGNSLKYLAITLVRHN